MSAGVKVSYQAEDLKTLVQRFNIEFIEQGDESVFEDLVAPGFVNHSAPAALQSRAATLHWFTRVLRPAFPDLKISIHAQYVDGDTVVTRKSYAGTHSAELFGIATTGRFVQFEMIDIIRIAESRYQDHWSTIDIFGMVRQLNQ